MVRSDILVLLLALLLATGCAPTLEPVALPRGHPANPTAAETEPPSPSQTLRGPEVPPLADAFNDTGAHGGHGGHAAGVSSPAATRPATTQAAYVCPMHPEVRSAQPGRCRKCGMNLVPAGVKR